MKQELPFEVFHFQGTLHHPRTGVRFQGQLDLWYYPHIEVLDVMIDKVTYARLPCTKAQADYIKNRPQDTINHFSKYNMKWRQGAL